MKAKIVYVASGWDWDECEGRHHILDGIEWEDVSDADAQLLARHINGLPPWNGLKARLLVQSPAPLKSTLADIVTALATKEQAEQLKREEARIKREARGRIQSEKAIKAKRELLAKLQKELAVLP